jgi:hypothetical protein
MQTDGSSILAVATIATWGSAAGGFVIGWFSACRAGTKPGHMAAIAALGILGLALPYLILATVVAGASSGIAVVLGTVSGAFAYYGAMLHLLQGMRGR